MVSPDFQLSVLAELLREAASFLVIVDLLAQLRDVHKYRLGCAKVATMGIKMKASDG
jgi:hypothetical protein